MESSRWQELGFLEESGVQGIRNLSKKEQEEVLNKLSASMETWNTKCLAGMESVFSTGQEQIFYQVFAHAYWEAYFKRKRNKAQYWNLKTLLLSAAGVSGAGAAVFGGIFTLLNTLLSHEKLVSGETAAQLIPAVKAYGPLCFGVLAAFVLMRFSWACLRDELARRNYRETWVRHSVTYHKLSAAMVRFQSGMMGKVEFMERVMEILEGSVQQFEYNITGKGRADSGREASGE